VPSDLEQVNEKTKNQLRRTDQPDKPGRPTGPVAAWGAVLGLATLVQVFLPLFGVPGYEAAEFQTILFAFASGHLAISFFHRQKPGGGGVALTAARAGGTTFLLLAGTTGVIVLSGLLKATCDWGASMLWFLILPAVTLILGTAWGAFVAATVGTRKRAHLVFFLIVLVQLGIELLIIWKQPVTFSYSSLLGYFPGPVYDRAVRLTVPLAASRAQAIACAVFLVAAAQIIAKIRTGSGKRRGGVNSLEIQAAAIALTALLLLFFKGEDLGTRIHRGFIEKELGGRVVGRNVILHYPEDLTDAELRLLLLDVEHRFAQQSRFLELKNPPPVNAYFYRSSSEKKRLMGAAQTQYADCANREIHMNLSGSPIRILKHEIVHVLTGPWGIPGLGFSRVLGVTEGVAVASEVWRGDYTIPRWAAAMKAVGRLPRISKISGPTGFWKLSGTRSYIAWGAFFTWLLENHSMDAVRRVYRTGDFEAVFGKPLSALETEWEKSLGSLTVPPRLLRQASYKFFRPSLFEGRCARSVGKASQDGRRAMRKNRFLSASRLFAKASEFSGGNTRYTRYLMNALFEARRYDDAWETAREIIDIDGAGISGAEPGAVVRGNLAAAARALATQARIAWLRGNLEQAKDLYEKVRDIDVIPSLSREAAVALLSFRRPGLEEPLRRYLVDPDAASASFFPIMKALESLPEEGVLHYLLGRRLAYARQYDEAVRELDLALKLGLEDEALAVEAWLTLGKTLFFAGRYEEAASVFADRRQQNLTEGKVLAAEEWIGRCRFAADYGGAKAGGLKKAEPKAP